MSIILIDYKENVDRCWYDSTNILYSECIDHVDGLKDLKVIFSGGRTYLYKEVNVNDYLLFKHDLSQGKALNKYIIKKYTGVRLPDIDLSIIENEKKLILENNAKLAENSVDKEVSEENEKTLYHIEYEPNTKDISLFFGEKLIFNGINGEIDLFNLMTALGIKCSLIEIKKGE